MGRTAKIAVSLDRELLLDAERVRRRTGEARSALVARALRSLLQAEERQLEIEAYKAAYRAHPETKAEVKALQKLAQRALVHLPWDDE